MYNCSLPSLSRMEMSVWLFFTITSGSDEVRITAKDSPLPPSRISLYISSVIVEFTHCSVPFPEPELKVRSTDNTMKSMESTGELIQES